MWDPARIIVAALHDLGPSATAAGVRDYIAHLRAFPGIGGLYDFVASPQRGLGLSNAVVVRWDAAKQDWLPRSPVSPSWLWSAKPSTGDFAKVTTPDRINRRRALKIAGGIIGAGSGALGAPLAAAAAAPDLVLDGVTVVDTRDGSLTHNMAIAVADGKIVRIAPAGTILDAGTGRGRSCCGQIRRAGLYNDFHCHPLSSGRSPKVVSR